MKEFQITLEDLCKLENPPFGTINPHFRNEIRGLIKAKFKSVKSFSREMNMHDSTLYLGLCGKRSIRINKIKEIGEKLNLNFKNITEIIRSMRSNSTTLNSNNFPIKGSPELASLVGHCFGDGHISDRRFTYTNKEPKLINDVIEKVYTLPFRNVILLKRFHKATTIEFPKLVRDVLVVAGAPIGNKVKKPFHLPKWIKEGSLEIKKAFLQALFDDESTVKVNSREILLTLTKTIELSTNLQQFFDDIKLMLEEFKIEGVTLRDCSQSITGNGKVLEKGLRITGTLSFINFQKNVGFLHPRKKKSLSSMIESTQRFQCRIGENKKRIVELLKDKRQLNTLEVARMTGLQHLNAFIYLTRLEKEGKVERVRPPDRSKPHIWFLISN
jgi:intein/homing endonuclease